MTDTRKFWSIEYIDEDGDLITTNILATTEEMKKLMDEFARRGMKAETHDLSPPAVNSSNALLS